MLENTVENLLKKDKLKTIVNKIIQGKRLSQEEGLKLYKEGGVGLLGSLANIIREKKNGNKVFFNKNIHIEPTNICVFDCKFCSYSVLIQDV